MNGSVSGIGVPYIGPFTLLGQVQESGVKALEFKVQCVVVVVVVVPVAVVVAGAGAGGGGGVVVVVVVVVVIVVLGFVALVQ